MHPAGSPEAHRELETWRALMDPGSAEDFFQVVPMPPFDCSQTSDLNWSRALWLMEFSRLIYRQDEDEDETWISRIQRRTFLQTANTGWHEDAFFMGEPVTRTWMHRIPFLSRCAADTHCAFYTHASENVGALIFRGTLGNQNLITDLRFLAWPRRGRGDYFAHLGFHEALETVWCRISERIASFTGRVFIAGHSLGAALATLAAARLSDDHQRKIAGIYTFGSPRVGDAGLTAELRGIPVFRIVNGDDLVTEVPPAFSLPLFPVYQHIGERIRLTPRGPIHDGPRDVRGWPAVKAFCDAASGLWRRNQERKRLGRPPPQCLADHTPRNYTVRIARSLGTFVR